MFLSVRTTSHHQIVRMKVTKKKKMPDENLSPESQEESVGIEEQELEEEESSTRRRSGGGYSPHSTTTTGTTPPSRKRVKPKEEEESATAVHAGSSATSDSDVDTSADKNSTHLKHILAATIKLSGSISRQHSDRALQIITDLLIGAIDSTEFQQRVTQLVHLPFRPIVLPLMDKQLNWLRRELAARLHPVRLLAQHSSGPQTTTHYVKEHVKALLSLDRQDSNESSASNQQQQLGVWQVFQPGAAEGGIRAPGGSGTAGPASVGEATQPANNSNNNTRKRRASASLVENGGGAGTGADEMGEESRKRVALYSTPVWIPPKGNSQQQQYGPAGGQRQVEREMSSSTKSSSSFSSSSHPSTLMTSFQPQQGDEEWANIHTMLNCILSMVEKTRRALGILQQRATNDNQLHQQKRRDSSSTSSSSLIHHHQQVTTYEASELRRQAGELIAQTLKATEDRVSQVKRKAEEAVHDVRRAAMAELQRALSAERLRAERLAAEARRQGAEEALSALGQHAMMQSGGSHHHHHQTSSSPANKEVCWNCGRRANETCSGCNSARYCSTFCQHKHWEIHHKICGRVSQVMLAAADPSSGSSMDHQSESNGGGGGSPSSSSQHRNSSKTPSPVQQTSGASYVH
uniref:Uncharacterized protein n=1 Tax=Daphnia galeata TaxID=27404 RepID=A0A8J2WNG5_9CRUS|nr:unnamed protein product [Daphnia galeata]